MSIILPRNLPARRTLEREGIEVLESAPRDGGNRPLRIALCNLMPAKGDTETQIARLLGATPHRVELTLFIPDSCRPKHTSAAHLAAFYRTWSQIRDQAFDGLIVTGTPVETLPFEAVDYWRELTEIFDWAQRRVHRSFHICWGAQAALQHFHGVPKHPLKRKMFGVFEQRITAPRHRLLAGFDAGFPVPVSRHTEVRAADLPRSAGLEILAGSSESGLCLLQDTRHRAVYMFNHLEYDAGTLAREYERDRKAGKAIDPPANCFPAGDPAGQPVNRWRAYAHLLFRNWLDEMARAAQGHAARARVVDWMLAERRGPMIVDQAVSDFLICGTDSADTLPLVLRRMAALNLSPQAAKVHRQSDSTALIELRTDALPEARLQRVAREMLRLDEVRRVTYRGEDGSGGTYVGKHSDAESQHERFVA